MLTNFCLATTAGLFTFFALHSRRGWRWGGALSVGAGLFLFSTVSLAFPGLSLKPGGLLLTWLPFTLALNYWSMVFACFSQPAMSASPDSPDRTLDQDLRRRVGLPVYFYATIGSFTLLAGLILKEARRREAVVVVLGLLYRLVWPMHLWAVLVALEDTWGYEWVSPKWMGVGSRGLQERVLRAVMLWPLCRVGGTADLQGAVGRGGAV